MLRHSQFIPLKGLAGQGKAFPQVQAGSEQQLIRSEAISRG